MNFASISHRNTEDYIYPIGRQELVISLSAQRDDLTGITLLWWPRTEADRAKRTRRRMALFLQDRYLDYYRTVVQTEGISAYTRYCFVLEGHDGAVTYFGPHGFYEDEDDENFFEFLWPNPTDAFPAPSFSSDLVYYQIFPERFRSADPALIPAGADPWGTPPTRENFMGGDLRGITEKLDYIASLGVNCLYLTPVFKAPSNHKYDTVDYFEIDPSFGSKEDLRELVNGVHARGMKILLDGVFNHCGYYWPPFQDLVAHGEASRYRNWFFPHSYPVSEKHENYDCVGHYKWMPKINLADAEAKQYFISVGMYWIENFGIDGWRLDVADEVPVLFWEEFAAAMRSVKSDVLLLGETWGDAHRLVTADRLDTAMNYIFRDIAVDWLAKGKILPSDADHRINRMLAQLPYETALRMYNPLDSHDTARFRTLCADKRMHELAVVLQMTLPGCPAVFYGDEIGLEGENDPGCRLCMEWDGEKQDQALLSLYRKLIAIRNSTPALRAGDYHRLLCDDGQNVYGFTRSIPEQTVAVLLNAGDRAFRAEISTGGDWTSLTGDKTYSPEKDGVCIELPPFSAEILLKKER